MTTETIEQIALRLAGAPQIVGDGENLYVMDENEVQEFARRLVAALGAQKPVAEYWLPMHINGQIDLASDPITSEDDCENAPLIDGWKWTKLYLYAAPVLGVSAQPEDGRIEPFAVKHYSEDEHPSIKGNGFDGLLIGDDREEAQDFVDWINSKLNLSPTTVPYWQPIETAPKDGTYVLVGNEFGTWIAYYRPVYTSGFVPTNPWQSLLFNHEHFPNVRWNLMPTHWMPLPAAPKP